MVYILADLDLPVRGRTYVEPSEAHVAVARGRHAAAALAHAAAREDCLGVALIGLGGAPDPLPGLEALAGRRLLVVDHDRARLRSLTGPALAAGVEVEWSPKRGVPVETVAAWALPVAGVVLAGPGPGGNPLRQVGARPAVLHAVEAAREGGCHLTVALCADGEAGRKLAPEVTVVNLPALTASAVAAALEALPRWISGFAVLRGDRVLAGPRTVAMLLKGWRSEHAPPAVAVAEAGGWAPPVVMDRPCLKVLTEPGGGRELPFELPAAWVGRYGVQEGRLRPPGRAGALRVFRGRES